MPEKDIRKIERIRKSCYKDGSKIEGLNLPYAESVVELNLVSRSAKRKIALYKVMMGHGLFG